MIADFARALAESGTSVVVDGETIQVFISQVEDIPTEVEQLIVSRKKIYHLAGALTEKVPLQLIKIDDEEWNVISHRAGKCSVCLSVERILS
jgi:hypothetical protein